MNSVMFKLGGKIAEKQTHDEWCGWNEGADAGSGRFIPTRFSSV